MRFHNSSSASARQILLDRLTLRVWPRGPKAVMLDPVREGGIHQQRWNWTLTDGAALSSSAVEVILKTSGGGPGGHTSASSSSASSSSASRHLSWNSTSSWSSWRSCLTLIARPSARGCARRRSGCGTGRRLRSIRQPSELRVIEALDADIEALGLERGHRTLAVARKGGKIVTIPLAPRTARAIDLAIGERLEGPIFLDTHGECLDRHAAGRMCGDSPAEPGSTGPSDPAPSATPSSPPPTTPAYRSVTREKPPATPTPGPPCATTEPASHSTATPPTSSPPSSPEPHGSQHHHGNPAAPILARRDPWSRKRRSVVLDARGRWEMTLPPPGTSSSH